VQSLQNTSSSSKSSAVQPIDQQRGQKFQCHSTQYGKINMPEMFRQTVDGLLFLHNMGTGKFFFTLNKES